MGCFVFIGESDSVTELEGAWHLRGQPHFINEETKVWRERSVSSHNESS